MSTKTAIRGCFSAEDICKIIKQCEKSQVKQINLGSNGIAVDFYSEDSFGGKKTCGENFQPNLPSNLPDTPLTDQSEGRSPLAENPPQGSEQAAETNDMALLEERVMTMAVTDPMAWEEEELRELKEPDENAGSGHDDRGSVQTLS